MSEEGLPLSLWIHAYQWPCCVILNHFGVHCIVLVQIASMYSTNRNHCLFYLEVGRYETIM